TTSCFSAHSRFTIHLPTLLLFSHFSLLTTTLLLPFFFFFNDTATTVIYTLSLHDALPIWLHELPPTSLGGRRAAFGRGRLGHARDRKSTRLNSSHRTISYAVFCLKKKKKKKISKKK